MKRILFELNEYNIREKQGYLLESSQKIVDYVSKEKNQKQVNSIEITPEKLEELGIVHNDHGIEIYLNFKNEDGKSWDGLSLPYFKNGGKNSVAYIKDTNKVVLRHELIHCLDYNRYWERDNKEKKNPNGIRTTSENTAFTDHNFEIELKVFTYMYDISERFAWLANIEEELNKESHSETLDLYEKCFNAFYAGMYRKRPTCMVELKENFPALCIYNEACLPTSGIPYLMPRILADTNITKDNFFTALTDAQFEEMRATLYEYLERNWKMIENIALQMQNS